MAPRGAVDCKGYRNIKGALRSGFYDVGILSDGGAPFSEFSIHEEGAELSLFWLPKP